MAGLATLRRASDFAFAGLLMAATALLFPAVTIAETYPSRAVKILVPFPAGGPLDTTARLLAEKLAANTKQPFIVENRPGAAGNLGTEAVARAPADGYTLLLVLDTPLTVNPSLYPKLEFDPVRIFTPISAVASFSLTLVMHPSVPVRSVSEFVAYAKTRKDKPVLYGSGGGPGNPGHLAMEYFRQQAGFEAAHVPYKGNSEVVLGLVGGQIEAGFLAEFRRVVERAGRPAQSARGLQSPAHIHRSGNPDHCGERVPRLRGRLLSSDARACGYSGIGSDHTRARSPQHRSVRRTAGALSRAGGGADRKHRGRS